MRNRSRDLIEDEQYHLGRVSGKPFRWSGWLYIRYTDMVPEPGSKYGNAVHCPSFPPVGVFDHINFPQENNDSDLIAYLKSLAPAGSEETYNGILTRKIKSITDVVVPGYRKLSAQGVVINNPMLSVKSTFVGGVQYKAGSLELVPTVPSPLTSKVTCTVIGAGYWKEWNGYQGGYAEGWNLNVIFEMAPEISSELVIPTSAYRKLEEIEMPLLDPANALNNAYGNINGAEMDLLVSLAEGHKTVGHLAGTVARFAKLLLSIRRGNISQLSPSTYKKWKRKEYGQVAANAPEVVADAWLEARYAWTPLIYDVCGALTILSGTAYAKRKTFRGKDIDNSQEELDFEWTENGLHFRLQGLRELDMAVRAGHLCENRFETQTMTDLGLTNILGMIKELIPWSFVFEWFVNLNGFIYRLNPTPSFRILASWITYSTVMRIGGTVTVTAPNGSKETIPFQYSKSLKDRRPTEQKASITIDTSINMKRILDSFAFLRRVGS